MGKAGTRKGAPSSGSAEGPLKHLKPSQIDYTFSKILPYFSGCGRTLQGTLDQITSGELSPHDLPAISVIGAEVPAASSKGGGSRQHGEANDGWSSDEDGGGRGRGRGGGKKADKRGGGGGGGGGKEGGNGNAKGPGAAEKAVKYYSTNNRRLWVLKHCEERGLLGAAGTVGVRMQFADVCRRLVEKGRALHYYPPLFGCQPEPFCG